MSLSTHPDTMSGENGQTQYTKIYEIVDGKDWVLPGCEEEVNSAMCRIVPPHVQKLDCIQTNQALEGDTCVTMKVMYRIFNKHYKEYFLAIHKDKAIKSLMHSCTEEAAIGIVADGYNPFRLHRFANGKGLNFSDLLSVTGEYGICCFVNNVNTGKEGRGKSNVLPSEDGFDTAKNGDIYVVEKLENVEKVYLVMFAVRPERLSIKKAQDALDKRRVFNSVFRNQVRNWLAQAISDEASKAPAASASSAGGAAAGASSAGGARRLIYNNSVIWVNGHQHSGYFYVTGNPVHVQQSGVPSHLQKFVDVDDKKNLGLVLCVLQINGKAFVIVRMEDQAQRDRIERHNSDLRRKNGYDLVTITCKKNNANSFTIKDDAFKIAINDVTRIRDATGKLIDTMSAARGAASAPAPATVLPNNVLNGPFGGPLAAPTIAAIPNGAAVSAQAPPASMKAPVAGGAGGASALPGFGEALVAFDKSQAAAPAPAPVAPAAHGGGASAQSAVGTTKRTAIVIDDDDARPNKKMRS